MNSTRRIIHKLAEESKGKMKIVEVPPEKRPTPETLARLKREVSAQINVSKNF